MRWSSRWGCAALGIVVAACPHAAAHAQWQSHAGAGGAALGAIVGSDVERYMRALEIGGIVAPVPWGARYLGAHELRRLLAAPREAAHPWQRDLQRRLQSRASLGVSVAGSFNGGFAWGANDGAMWQGRGVNGAVGLAASIDIGPLSAVFAPVAFVAQNQSFRVLEPTDGSTSLTDPQFSSVVDLPQRMGRAAYARIDPGESTIRLRAPGTQVGITTASLGWGTGEAFPAIFGANAGGFPRVFVGTDGRGLRIPRVGRLGTQYILGILQQSRWSPVQGSETYVDPVESGTRRLGTGLTVSFVPAVLPALEIGASRFYHSPYRAGADRWSAASKPFEGIFKRRLRATPGAGDPTGDADNQIASFFARLRAPRRGAEATIEVLREDHNWDSRDLAQEPENNSAVLASVRAITRRTADALSVVTFEYFDGDIRPIAQARAQEALYVHTGMRQGHTQRGQLLGAPMGVGAIAGQRVSWERFRTSDAMRVNVQWWRSRSRRLSDAEQLYRPPPAVEIPDSHDWILDASISKTRYRGPRALTSEIGVAWAGAWAFDASLINPYVRGSWTMF